MRWRTDGGTPIGCSSCCEDGGWPGQCHGSQKRIRDRSTTADSKRMMAITAYINHCNNIRFWRLEMVLGSIETQCMVEIFFLAIWFPKLIGCGDR